MVITISVPIYIHFQFFRLHENGEGFNADNTVIFHLKEHQIIFFISKDKISNFFFGLVFGVTHFAIENKSLSHCLIHRRWMDCTNQSILAWHQKKNKKQKTMESNWTLFVCQFEFKQNWDRWSAWSLGIAIVLEFLLVAFQSLFVLSMNDPTYRDCQKNIL